MVQQNPPRRGRSRTQLSREPSKEAGPEKGPDARRARKRETDRQSQRHHRERQRHYVKQLEETVEAYKSSLSEVGDVNVAALLAEQEELRRRCSELEATLIRIRTLAGSVSGPAENNGTPLDANKPTSPGQVQPTLSSPLSAEKDDEKENDIVALPGLDPIFGAAPVETPTPFFPQEPEDFALLSADFASLPAQQSYLGGPRITEVDSTHTDQSLSGTENVDEMLDSDDFNQCLASIIDGTEMNVDLVPASTAMGDPLSPGLAAQPIIPAQMPGALATLHHLGFPKFSQSMGSWDRTLMSIVDEGRVQHQYGHFDTTAPSLRRLLSNQCTDVVASRLFHYLCSSGPMPLHQLMSIFWVQYLVLRVREAWHPLPSRAFLPPGYPNPLDACSKLTRPNSAPVVRLGHSRGLHAHAGIRPADGPGNAHPA